MGQERPWQLKQAVPTAVVDDMLSTGNSVTSCMIICCELAALQSAYHIDYEIQDILLS